MSLEDRLAEFLKQPGTFVTRAEQIFIDEMRHAAKDGVGYGWMQQVIEWEWQSKGLGAWGPESHRAEIERLQAVFKRIAAGITPDPIAAARDALSGEGET